MEIPLSYSCQNHSDIVNLEQTVPPQMDYESVSFQNHTILMCFIYFNVESVICLKIS